MTYMFNPFTYHPSICAECGASSAMGKVRVTVAGKRYDVPALYLCGPCDRSAALSRVTPTGIYVWLVHLYIPRMEAAMQDGSAARSVTAIGGMGVGIARLADAVAADVVSAAELAEALGRELLGLNAEPEPGVAVFDYHGDYESDAADMAAALDLRREADGTVTYKCPNPDCPEGNRHPMSFASSLWDSMPIEFVNALQAHLPG